MKVFRLFFKLFIYVLNLVHSTWNLEIVMATESHCAYHKMLEKITMIMSHEYFHKYTKDIKRNLFITFWIIYRLAILTKKYFHIYLSQLNKVLEIVFGCKTHKPTFVSHWKIVSNKSCKYNHMTNCVINHTPKKWKSHNFLQNWQNTYILGGFPFGGKYLIIMIGHNLTLNWNMKWT